MTARVIALRPRPRPRAVPAAAPVPSRPSSAVPPVRVEWDGVRALHIAYCERCATSLTSSYPADVEDWADVHRCDEELAALLALVTARPVTVRRAA